MFLQAFTLLHVAISLVGIVSGFAVVLAFIAAKPLHRWTSTFLATTALTSVTGFMFPFHGFLPSYGLAILSLLVLAPTLFALYKRHLAGPWRRTYVIGAVIALYLNFFVLIAQLFMKVPALKAMAPTQTELPFKIAQGFALTFFLILGILATRNFHAEHAVTKHAKSRAA